MVLAGFVYALHLLVTSGWMLRRMALVALSVLCVLFAIVSVVRNDKLSTRRAIWEDVAEDYPHQQFVQRRIIYDGSRDAICAARKVDLWGMIESGGDDLILAEELFRSLYEQIKDAGTAHGLGRALARLGRSQEARHYLQIAVRLDPHNTIAADDLRQIDQSREHSEVF